jgi:hypothetical protein
VAGEASVKESEVELPAFIWKALIWPFTGKSLKTWARVAVEDKTRSATANRVENRPRIECILYKFLAELRTSAYCQDLEWACLGEIWKQRVDDPSRDLIAKAREKCLTK